MNGLSMIRGAQSDSSERLRAVAAKRWPDFSETELTASLADDWVLVCLLQNRYGLTREEAVTEMISAFKAARSQ